jgi:Tfp pilus assembly protein PilP
MICRILLLLLLLGIQTLVAESRLLKAHMVDNGRNLSIEFIFSKQSGSSNIPRFFQEFSQETGFYSINFLKTATAIKEGRYKILSTNAFASHMMLTKLTRKKGNTSREFLSLQFRTPGAARAKYPTSVTGPRTLVLNLGESSGKPFHWTATSSTQPVSVPKKTAALQQRQETVHDSLPGQGQTFREAEIKEPEPIHIDDALGTKSALELGVVLEQKLKKKKRATRKTFSITPGKIMLIILQYQTKLREGAGTHTKIIRALEIGSEVEKLGKKKNWFRVAANGDTGYIRQDLLAFKAKITLKQRQRIEQKMALKQEKELKRKQREELVQQKRNDAKRKTIQRAKQKKQEEEELIRAAERERKRKKEEALEKKAALERKKKEENRRRKELEKKVTLEKQRLAELERIQKEKEKALKLAQKKKAEEAERLKRKKERERVRYTSFGRRDPFVPVEQIPLNDKDINLDQMKLVGIIWNPQDPLAVLEHRTESSISIAVRKGDRIAHGKVTHITHESVVFEILEYGVYRSYTLKLESTEERTQR